MIQAELNEDIQRKRAVRTSWILVVAWAVFIFVMSATSGHDFESGSGLGALLKGIVSSIVSPIVGHEVDVSPIGHFGEYLVFGGLLLNALRHHVPSGKAALGAIGIAALYAITDEFHQLFVPGRMCDPADWLVDVCAASLAALVGFLLLRRKR